MPNESLGAVVSTVELSCRFLDYISKKADIRARLMHAIARCRLAILPLRRASLLASPARLSQIVTIILWR